MKNIKILIAILLIIPFSEGFSQQNFAANTNESHVMIKKSNNRRVGALHFNYGSQRIDLSNLSNYLMVNNYDNRLEYWGFGLNTLKNRKYIGLNFNYYNKHKKSVNDSVKTILDGTGVTLNLGYDFAKGNKVDVIGMIGFGYQIIETEIEQGYISTSLAEINHVKYIINNPAFTIDLSLETRVPISKRVAFSFKGGYKFDLSNKQWDYPNAEKNLEVSTSIEGAYVQASICFGNFLPKKWY